MKTMLFLGNATNGIVDGFVSIPYPVPYLGLSGFQYLNAIELQGCPAGFDMGVGPGGCSCIMESLAAVQVAQSDNSYEVTAVAVSPTSKFYQVLNSHPIGNDLGDIGGDVDIGTFNTASFSDFLSSASVFKSYPELRSCAIFDNYNGPLGLMIPATAFTATIKTTTTSVGSYNASTPKPAGPIKPTTALRTAEAPSSTEKVQAASVPAPKIPVPAFPGIPTASPVHLESPNVSSSSSPEVPINALDAPGSSDTAAVDGTSINWAMRIANIALSEYLVRDKLHLRGRLYLNL